MKITTVFDTETTGFVKQNLSPGHPDQPYLVQLAAQQFHDRRLVAEVSLICIPEFKGVVAEIPEHATNVHRIDDALVASVGVSYKVALPIFNNMLRKSDRLIAHNMDFDYLVMLANYSRISADQDILRRIPKGCTMKGGNVVDSMKIPNKNKRGFKWPNLDEAYKKLVDPAGFGDAHNAMADVRAAVAVLWALEDKGVDVAA